MNSVSRPRARDLGIPFEGMPGPLNAITDTKGVSVGHHTLVDDEGARRGRHGAARTGVTVIHPLGKDARRAVTAGRAVINGTGEWTGMHVVDELGEFHGPIGLTGTGNLAVVHSAISRWGHALDHPTEDDRYMRLLPLVGETLDSRLNDVFFPAVTHEHVVAALENATAGPVAEGNVGGGTGMVAYDFKGGIGTSSRVVRVPGFPEMSVGVLLQANHGRRADLVVAGIPVGLEITDLMPGSGLTAAAPEAHGADRKSSLLIVVATDAPLLPHQLARLARRACFGVGRCGSTANAMSGEFVLAFSTADTMADRHREHGPRTLEPTNGLMNALFAAVAQSVEEALINQLVASDTMRGIDDRVVHAFPHGRMIELLHRHGRLTPGH